jgi:hypothetical protein
MATCARIARQRGLSPGSAAAPEQQRSPPRGAAEENVSSLPCRVALPKGGSAIRGVGEKLTDNSGNGPGSLSVPIAMSPGRSGFGPQHPLSNDSGAGHGPWGLGRSLSLPSITRKTDKGLSKHRDAEESDVFIFSDAEDLVPVRKEQGGRWAWDSFDRTVRHAAYDAGGNFPQRQHGGSEAADPGRMRAYRTNEPSQIAPAAQSHCLTSATIGGTTETYGSGGDGYGRHTSESEVERRNGNERHSIVCGHDRYPLYSRRAIGLGGLCLN